MNTLPRHRPLVAATCAAALLAPWAGLAQELEEVIVTATKRESSAQSVPIPLTGISAEQIQKLGITSTYDLSAYAPGLQLKPQFGVTSPDIVLRGVGSQSFFPNTISPVGFYSDGVYIGQSIVQGFQLFDVERIEVLRGPQGTLFGRNTTGGLVNVISQKPEVGGALQGHVEVSAGDYGALSADAAVGAPLGAQSAGRLAVLHQESDGAFDNVFRNSDDGAIDLTSARAQLRWQPVEALDVLLNAHAGWNRGQIRPQKAAYPAAATLPPSSLPPAYQPPIDNCPPGAPTDGSFQSGCTDQFGFGLTDADGYHDTKTSFESVEDVDTHGFSAEVNWQLGRHTLTSVTA
jgi:iron complex outermembrane receptor protein